MKITIVHTNNKKQLLVSNKTMEKLLERIAKDDSKNTVTHFREYVTYMESGYEYYKDMPTWMHIYPAAEFAKDENNNLKMKACNGILLLKFGNITDVDGVEGVKRSVAMLPSTFAALEGADGKSVIVLVKFSSGVDVYPCWHIFVIFVAAFHIGHVFAEMGNSKSAVIFCDTLQQLIIRSLHQWHKILIFLYRQRIGIDIIYAILLMV